jgi:hypothetical protein
MRSLRPLICSVALLALAGCATWGPGGAPHHHAAGYTLTVPAGWIFHPSFGGELLATRDGVILQRLEVLSIPLPDTLPISKRIISRDLTPFEIAENLADEGKADRALQQFTMSAQAAVKISGLDGVRLDSTHTTEEGLRLGVRRWAVVRGDRLWLATYTAPTRHYYERDLPAVTAAIEAVNFDAISAP